MLLFNTFLLYFFFLRIGPPLDLHSFPTRRSSDLDTSVNAANQVVSVGADIAFDADPKFFANRNNLDRKSGSAGMPRPISYAVFCLKKKRDPLVDESHSQIGL